MFQDEIHVELSGRARKKVQQLGLQSWEEIADSYEKLFASKNCGLTTMRNIIDALARKGLAFNNAPAEYRYSPSKPGTESHWKACMMVLDATIYMIEPFVQPAVRELFASQIATAKKTYEEATGEESMIGFRRKRD